MIKSYSKRVIYIITVGDEGRYLKKGECVRDEERGRQGYRERSERKRGNERSMNHVRPGPFLEFTRYRITALLGPGLVPVVKSKVVSVGQWFTSGNNTFPVQEPEKCYKRKLHKDLHKSHIFHDLKSFNYSH